MATIRIRVKITNLGEVIKGFNPFAGGVEVIGAQMGFNIVDPESERKALDNLKVGKVYVVDWTPEEELTQWAPDAHKEGESQ